MHEFFFYKIEADTWVCAQESPQEDLCRSHWCPKSTAVLTTKDTRFSPDCEFLKPYEFHPKMGDPTSLFSCLEWEGKWEGEHNVQQLSSHHGAASTAGWATGSTILGNSITSTLSCTPWKSISESNLTIFLFLAARNVPTSASKIFAHLSSLNSVPNFTCMSPIQPH